MSELNTNNNNSNELRAECSDDENYNNFDTNYRIVNGKRIWEPVGEEIGSLYKQLESKGFIELRWQCPGRRSPSVHSIINTIIKSSDNADHDSNNGLNSKSNELNEFDFETESNEITINSMTAKVNHSRRRSNQGLKKSQTNLNKVMADIKKYQKINEMNDQQIQQTPQTPQTTQNSKKLWTESDNSQTN